MKEQYEIQMKTALCNFIRSKFVLEGDPILIDQKVKDLSVGIYEMFHPPENFTSHSNGADLVN